MIKRTARNTDRRMRLNDYISNDYFNAGNTLRGDTRTVVYVEGYDDVSFWRRVFDRVEIDAPKLNDKFRGRKFKIMTPVRADLAKGKKVVLSFCDRCGDNLLLCVDSDFDYLLGDSTEQSTKVNNCQYLIQTYTYAIENLFCDPRTLHSVAVRVTNNDEMLFDFAEFFKQYSQIMFPLFKWYYWSAASNRVDVFPLAEFKLAARLNFLELFDNGAKTLDWLQRKIDKVLLRLEHDNAGFVDLVAQSETYLRERGVTADTTHFYMQGHTLEEEVVKPMLQSVCDRLRAGMQLQIENSWAKNISKRNQLSGYTNALSDIDIILHENVGYMGFDFFDRIMVRILSLYI